MRKYRFYSTDATVRYTNTVSQARLAVYRNVFGLIVETDDYEPGAYLQTKHATYQEIQTWVKQRYNLHVSNHAISQVKALCGLARDGPGGAEGQDGPKLRSDKEAAIREAFLWFGIIKRE